MDELLEAARASALFQGLSVVQAQDVAALGSRVALEPGQRLFAEGDPADAMYLVATGSIAIVKEGDGPVDRVLGTVPVGEAFGEMALLLDAPRMASAIAQEATVLLRIDRYGFLELLESQDPVASGLLLNLARMLCARLNALES